MAIFGPSMVDSDKGGVAYGGVLMLISQRIGPRIDALDELADGENSACALIEALRTLCERHPVASGVALKSAEIEGWKARLLPWLESRKSKIPAKYRDKIIESVKGDLDYLLEIADF